jgi:hypothetical protein
LCIFIRVYLLHRSASHVRATQNTVQAQFPIRARCGFLSPWSIGGGVASSLHISKAAGVRGSNPFQDNRWPLNKKFCPSTPRQQNLNPVGLLVRGPGLPSCLPYIMCFDGQLAFFFFKALEPRTTGPSPYTVNTNQMSRLLISKPLI